MYEHFQCNDCTICVCVTPYTIFCHAVYIYGLPTMLNQNYIGRNFYDETNVCHTCMRVKLRTARNKDPTFVIWEVENFNHSTKFTVLFKALTNVKRA